MSENKLNLKLVPNYRGHCKNGHEWSEKTAYTNKTSGSRICRACRADSQKRSRSRAE